jgi:hypothetical protein
MVLRRVALVVVIAAFFWGCGGKVANGDGSSGGSEGGPGTGPSDPNKPTDGSCPPVGATYCSADPATSADDVEQCNKALNDPTCGSTYKTALTCEEAHVTCDATKHIDGNALLNACGDLLNAYEQCIESLPTPPSH